VIRIGDEQGFVLGILEPIGRAVEGGRRVFILGDAERLVPQESSQEAANALLKVLEEPPPGTVFALVSARRPLLSNTLVVVSNIPLRNPRDLLRVGRIALGDPNAVPAGVYARQYLQRIGLWRDLLPKIIPMENVRAALASVDGGNVDAAIVYKTDAMLARRARVAFEIDGPDAPHIVYPVAIVRSSRHPAAARRFFGYLTSPEAAAVFRRFGFVTLPPTRPASSRSVGTTSRPPVRPRS